MVPYMYSPYAKDAALFRLTNIDKVTGNSGSGSHGRADQVGASTTALTAFKITVAGRSAALTLGELIAIHSNTHAAPCLAPLETSISENVGQSLFFSHAPHAH